MPLFHTAQTNFPVAAELAERGDLHDIALQRERLHWLAYHICELLRKYITYWQRGPSKTTWPLERMHSQWDLLLRYIQDRPQYTPERTVAYLRAVCSTDKERLHAKRMAEPMVLDVAAHEVLLKKRRGDVVSIEPLKMTEDRRHMREWVGLAAEIFAAACGM